MKRFVVLLALGCAGTGFSQTADFENLNLPLDTFYNGQDSSAYLSSGIEFVVRYDTSFGGFWSGGVAASTMRDTATGDFTNLYSSVTGGGHNSNTYGVVAPINTPVIVNQNPVPLGDYAIWKGVYITNTTYAYKSMRDGDAFAKKFGGATGDDPDYFFVRIFSGTGDSMDFYLADFRFTNNTEDYIIDEWTYVDLSPLNGIGPLSFRLFSSDNGAFGMNTPAFFCIDDLSIDYLMSAPEKQAGMITDITAAENRIILQTEQEAQLSIYSMEGRLVYNGQVNKGRSVVTCNQAAPGIYAVVLESGNGRSSKKVYLR